MTADQLVEILKSRGCKPMRQHDAHEVRDAVHETVHVLQSGSKSYERERLHTALEAAALRVGQDETRGAPTGLHRHAAQRMGALLRFELQARAVEMLVCKQFKIDYDIEHWAFIMWMETSKSYQVDIGDIETVRSSILIVSRQLETKWLFDRVMKLRPRKRVAR